MYVNMLVGRTFLCLVTVKVPVGDKAGGLAYGNRSYTDNGLQIC